MSELGICINANGAVPDADECGELGLTPSSWVRTPIQGSLSLLDAALERLPRHTNLMVALNSECQEVGPDWSGWESACTLLARRYADRVKIVGCGNELDLWHLQPPVGAPDPRLTPAFAAELVRRASPILRPAGIKVAMSSVASGSWFDYLEEMANLCRREADYADLHLYVKRVDGLPPGSDPIIWQEAEAALNQARERSGGLPVICSEAGIKVVDAGGFDQQAAWGERLLGLAKRLNTATFPLVCLFAWSDGIGTEHEQGLNAFGARGADGEPKPLWFALQRSFGGPRRSPVEPAPRPPRPAEGARFQLGFAEWSALEPALLGTPLASEHSLAPGISTQETSTGTLLWIDARRADRDGEDRPEIFLFHQRGASAWFRWRRGLRRAEPDS
jgi:hypothetical protein